MLEIIINFITNNTLIIIYILIVTLAASWLIFIVSRSLKLIENKKKERLKNKNIFSAVKTKSPVDNHAIKAKQLGLISIEKRFTISQKIIIPFILLAACFLIFIPFGNKMPGTIL